MLSDSPPITTRFSRSRSCGPAVLVAGAAMLLGGTAHSASWENGSDEGIAPMEQPAELHETTSVEEALATLLDGGEERATRDAAAEALVGLSRRPHAASAVTDILLGDEHPDARVILLRAISRTWDPPGRLFGPLVELARSTDAQRAAHVMPAIAAYATREAARVLIEHLAAERPAAVRHAAAASLVRMTGRDDLRAQQAAWDQWLREASRMSEGQWRDLLAEGVWRRADRLDADRRTLADRLAEGFRRLYIATAAEDRPRLLSQMLLDSQAEIRDIALEIVSRELAGGKTMDGPVTDAAVRLLQSEDARVRARATLLVSQLNATATAAAVASALQAEQKAEPAAAMLQALARSPHGDAAGPVLRWLSVAETRSQAIDAALAMSRAGHLQDDASRKLILKALRTAEPGALSASGIRLLAAMGEDDDRERIARMLRATEASSRVAAAEVLAEYPGFVDAILDAAQDDPALFAPAVRAVSVWEPTLAGARAISELAAPSAEEHRAGVLRVSEALRIVDLLAMASSARSDLSLREAMLERAADRRMGPFLPEEEEDLAAVGECILLLAETRLKLKRPDLALQAIEALPSAWDGITGQRAIGARVVSLLWTNRIEAAADIKAPASFWVDALELALEEQHATDLLAEIRMRHADSLSAEDAARLERLAEALDAMQEEQPAGEATEDPARSG